MAITSHSLFAEKPMVIDEANRKAAIGTVKAYFRALKTGDVDALKPYLPDEVYNKHKALLENNKEYPAFLRNYYKDIKYGVSDVQVIDGEVTVSFFMAFPGQNPRHSQIVLKKEKKALKHRHATPAFKVVPHSCDQ